MFEGAATRWMLVEMSEGSPEKIEKFRHRMLGLCHHLDEFDEIRCEHDAWILESQTVVGLAKFSFAQSVQVALSAATELHVAFKKQIEPSRKPALRLTRPLRHGLQFPMLLREPRNDQARLAELDFPKQNGGRGVQTAVES